jgi:hypothetical protein
MKKTVFLLAALLSFRVGAATNPTVVFTKSLLDGRTLEVTRTSVRYSPERLPVVAWTNYHSLVTTNTNSDGTVKITTNLMPVVVSRTQMRPLPDWLDTYSIVLRQGDTPMKPAYGSMAKLRNDLWADLEFVDVQYETNSAAFLYQSGRDPSGKWLFITLTGVAQGLKVNTNLPPPFSGGTPPFFGRGTTNSLQGDPALVWRVAVDRKLWAPARGSSSKLDRVRMTGSYPDGTLAVEVTSIAGGKMFTTTNRYVNDRWVVSEGEPRPVPDQP